MGVFPWFLLCIFVGGVYLKAIDFCKMILYPVTFLNLFIISGRFLTEFFGSLMYSIMPSLNTHHLNFTLPICIPLISSICLIVPDSILSILLKICGDNGHPCLLRKLSGMDSNFSASRLVLSEGFLYIVGIVFRGVPYSLHSLELLR